MTKTGIARNWCGTLSRLAVIISAEAYVCTNACIYRFVAVMVRPCIKLMRVCGLMYIACVVFTVSALGTQFIE